MPFQWEREGVGEGVAFSDNIRPCWLEEISFQVVAE